MKEIENLAKWYRLDMKAVNEAEQRMSFSFPKSLRTVYQKYGYGFVTNTEGAINRLMDPLTCADIRLREDIYECDPDLELYESSETDKILFFEVNEGVYISIGINDEKIYFMNEIIAYDLSEFLFKISENPDYWCE